MSLPRTPDGWTIDDLVDLPQDGYRYELVEGSLLVSPAAKVSHVRTVVKLRNILLTAKPHDLEVGENLNVIVGSTRTFFIPDLWVMETAKLEREALHLAANDLALVVEVLSRATVGVDRVTKRHYYAAGGVPRYWIVDPWDRTLTVLALDGDTYREEVVVPAGKSWRADLPFPVDLDPAGFC